jgi:hypothetical protein
VLYLYRVAEWNYSLDQANPLGGVSMMTDHFRHHDHHDNSTSLLPTQSILDDDAARIAATITAHAIHDTKCPEVITAVTPTTSDPLSATAASSTTVREEATTNGLAAEGNRGIHRITKARMYEYDRNAHPLDLLARLQYAATPPPAHAPEHLRDDNIPTVNEATAALRQLASHFANTTTSNSNAAKYSHGGIELGSLAHSSLIESLLLPSLSPPSPEPADPVRPLPPRTQRQIQARYRTAKRMNRYQLIVARCHLLLALT